MINLRVLNKSGHWNMVGEYLGKIQPSATN